MILCSFTLPILFNKKQKKNLELKLAKCKELRIFKIFLEKSKLVIILR